MTEPNPDVMRSAVALLRAYRRGDYQAASYLTAGMDARAQGELCAAVLALASRFLDASDELITYVRSEGIPGLSVTSDEMLGMLALELAGS